MYTSVRKVFSYFQYIENRLSGLYQGNESEIALLRMRTEKLSRRITKTQLRDLVCFVTAALTYQLAFLCTTQCF